MITDLYSRRDLNKHSTKIISVNPVVTSEMENSSKNSLSKSNKNFNNYGNDICCSDDFDNCDLVKKDKCDFGNSEQHNQSACYAREKLIEGDVKENITHFEKACTENGLTKCLSEAIVDNNCDETFLRNDAVITEIIDLPKLDLTNVLNIKDKSPIAMNLKKKLVERKPKNTIRQCLVNFKGQKFQNRPYLESPKNMLVDLEPNEIKAKKFRNNADKLLANLSKQNKICQNNSSMSSIKRDIVVNNQKPGAEYLQFKGTLKAIIEKKRRDEIYKKQIEEKNLIDQSSHNNDKNVVKSTSNFSSILVQKLDNSDLNNSQNDDNTFKNDRNKIKENAKDSKLNADEHMLELNDEVDSKLISFNGEPDFQNRLAFSKFIDKSSFNTEKDEISSNIEDELIPLCSGKFDLTQCSANIFRMQEFVRPESCEDSEIETLSPIREKISSSIENYNTQTDLSSDDNSLHEKENNRKRKLTKRLQKKQIKLGFSDDESDLTNDVTDIANDNIDFPNDNTDFSDDSTHLLNNTDPATEQLKIRESHSMPTHIACGSEKLKQLEKGVCLKNVADFFEKEAELSESEWDSADEDENNMDRYDIELGDEDKFDREQIREELEQIHARKMLDDDIKEVRKLQEMLIEDTENAGQNRTRQFKWKNFQQSFNLEILEDKFNGLKEVDNDIEDESLWRKLRFERERIISEQPSIENFEAPFQSSSKGFRDEKSTPKGSNLKKKLQGFSSILLKKKLNNTLSESKNSSFLISNGDFDMETNKMRRSFLIRDKDMLMRAAEYKRNEFHTTNNLDSGVIQAESIKPRKFVFETVREPEDIYTKRKTDDVFHHTSDVTVSKKLKLEKDKCIIDKLE